MSEIRILECAIRDVIGSDKDYLPVTYKTLKEIIKRAEEIRIEMLGPCEDRRRR